MNTSIFFENVTLFDDNFTTTTPLTHNITERWYWRVGLYAVGGACIQWTGVICNLISIIVLAHFKNSSSAPFLLICLAVFDSIYLLSIFFLNGLPVMVGGKLISNDYLVFIIPIFEVIHPLMPSSQTWIVYLVVVITIERFTVVAWPFHAHRFCSLKSAMVAVASIIMFGIFYHIPYYKAYQIYDRWENKTQRLNKVFDKNEFGKTYFFSEIYLKWMNLAVNFALPFAVLLIVNALTIKSLRNSRTGVAVRRAFTREERRLTVMVFCMTFIFFVCELFAALSLIMVAGFTTYTESSMAVFRFSTLADIFLLINSAINFAIYCVTGRKFRQTFVQLFCRFTNKIKDRQSLSGGTGIKSKQECSRSRSSSITKISVPKRSTTQSSLSSVSNGTRCSKFTLSSDSIHNKLTVASKDEQ